MRNGTWRRLSELDERTRLALELAERGTVTPPDVDDAFFLRLAEHYAPAEIVELTSIVAWENYRARFNVVLGVEGHGFYEQRQSGAENG